MFLICSGSVVVAGNGYRTDLLRRMATAMNIVSKADTMGEGVHYKALNYKDRPVTVTVERGRIVHIGCSLFPPEMKAALKSPVCDFIERYVLELSLPMKRPMPVARQLDEDGVFFRNGDLSTFARLQRDGDYNINVENLNDKRYTVSWNKDGHEVFAMNFPIEYELLNGTGMIENEQRLAEEIRLVNPAVGKQSTPDDDVLKATWHGKYYVLKGEYYYTERLNTDKYYAKDDDGLRLLYDKEFLVESLSNLLTTNGIDNEITIEICLKKYGFKEETITVPLRQWTAFCLDSGCVPFFGLIGIDNDVADCELIMRNKAEGYNHTMRLKVGLDVLKNRKGTVTARLNSYIPMARVKYLFDELKK